MKTCPTILIIPETEISISIDYMRAEAGIRIQYEYDEAWESTPFKTHDVTTAAVYNNGERDRWAVLIIEEWLG